MNTDLQRATLADIPRLDALMQASSAYQGEFAQMLEGYGVTGEQIDRDLFMVAEADGQLLGFYSLVTEGEPELDLMFVADAAQGTGLGARLFAHLAGEARAREIEAVKIIANPPAEGSGDLEPADPLSSAELGPIRRLSAPTSRP